MGWFDKNFSTSGKVVIGVVLLIVAVFILWGAVWVADKLPSIGATATSTPISPPSWLNSILNVVIGSGATAWTWESLILRIAIFAILFFALADIVTMFSTFSETVAWVIGFGLAVIAGVTKIIDYLAGLMGLTAGIGALGIIVIIIAAVVAAVLLNLGIGGAARKWRMKRQIEIEAMKSGQGAAKVTTAISGLKEVTREFKKNEKL